MRKIVALLIVGASLSAFSCGDGGSDERAADQAEANAENAADTITTNATMESQPMVFCPVVERRVSKDDCDDLAAIEGQVKEGAGAFNVPDPMTRGKAVSVVLVIDRRSPEEVAAIDEAAKEANAADAIENASANLTEEPAANTTLNETVGNEAQAEQPSHPRDRPKPAGPTPSQRVESYEGRTETLVPQVGRYMSADLIGDGFEIKALNPRSQEIPPNEQATWEWGVKPTVKGPHLLTLKTIVEGEVEGKRYPLARTETTKKVTVRVGPGDWLADAFDATIVWLNRMKLLLLALAGLIGAFWLLRRNLGSKHDDKE